MTTDHWQQTRAIHKEYTFFYQIVGGIILIILAALLGRSLFPSDEGYWSNFYMTLLGVLITILVLDRLAERREALREEKALKEKLIREMGSQVNQTALRAVEDLAAKKWLTDGTLIGVNLRAANLNDADFSRLNKPSLGIEVANLQKADLSNAKLKKVVLMLVKLQNAVLGDTDLQYANLWKVNLEKSLCWSANFSEAYLEQAVLRYADLKYAVLNSAKLMKADLTSANLEGAEMQEANLYDADLREANMENVKLEKTQFNKNTVLPDGTYWKPSTDMSRFTDSSHPNFWRSKDYNSPAYTSKVEENYS